MRGVSSFAPGKSARWGLIQRNFFISMYPAPGPGFTGVFFLCFLGNLLYVLEKRDPKIRLARPSSGRRKWGWAFTTVVLITGAHLGTSPSGASGGLGTAPPLLSTFWSCGLLLRFSICCCATLVDEARTRPRLAFRHRSSASLLFSSMYRSVFGGHPLVGAPSNPAAGGFAGGGGLRPWMHTMKLGPFFFSAVRHARSSWRFPCGRSVLRARKKMQTETDFSGS